MQQSHDGVGLLYAELDVLDARGDAVDDLLLGRGARCLHLGGSVLFRMLPVMSCYRWCLACAFIVVALPGMFEGSSKVQSRR